MRTPKVTFYYVYLVRCSDGTLYCGCTDNVDRRVTEHNSSDRGAKYTKTRRPVELVAISPPFVTRGAALSFEYKIKQLPSREKPAAVDRGSILIT